MSGTEVIPVSLLAQMSLDQQAHIILRQTTDASAQPYDAREEALGWL